MKMACESTDAPNCRRRILFAASFLLLVTTLPVQGQTDPAALELRVQRLLLQLEATERSQRDQAERELVAIGPEVLGKLPTVTDSTSAETKERLARVRQVLEKAAADQLMQPSQITLQGTYPLDKVLAEFHDQTGNRIVDFRPRMGQPATNPELTLDLNKADFWPALDQVMEQAELMTYEYTGEPRTLGVVARNRGENRDRALYRGVFRLEPTEIFAQRNLRVANDGAMRLRLNVMWEPRIAPIVIRQAYGDLAATASGGASIPIAMPQGASEVPVQSTVAGIDLVLPMALPDRSATAIDSFAGKLLATVPGREESFEFAELEGARNVSQTKAGIEVTLERVRRNGSVYEFRVRLRLLDQADTFQSHLNWAANNQAYLVGPDDKRIDNPNYEQYLERPHEVGFAYLFPLQGELKDYRLVYRSPVGILTVPVEYELTEIPLP